MLAGLAAIGSLSGCQNPLSGDGDGSGGDGRQPLSYVPNGAKAVVDVDVAATLEDEEIRDAVDAQLSATTDGDGPESLAAVMDTVQQQIGLDPRGVRSVLGYGTGLRSDAAVALVARTDWAASDLEAVFAEGNSSVREDSYAGLTVYEQGSLGEPYWLADLGDGRFAVGPKAEIRSVIDTTEGNADPVAGNTRKAFETTTPGYVRVGVDIPSERLAEDLQNAIVGSDTAAELEYAFGSLAPDGSKRVVTAGVETSSTSTARNVDDAVRGGLALYRSQLRETDRNREQGALLDALENTSVSRDGTTITVTYEASAAAFADLVGTAIASAVATLGLELQTDPEPPQVSFAFDYDEGESGSDSFGNVDAGDGLLSITHAGGDSVRAGNLILQVSGQQAERFEPWFGAEEYDASTTVTAGRSIDIRVDSGDTVRVTWVAPSSGSTATLRRWQGPDA